MTKGRVDRTKQSGDGSVVHEFYDCCSEAEYGSQPKTGISTWGDGLYTRGDGTPYHSLGVPRSKEPMMAGTDLIAVERQRQIDGEGYTPEHDIEHGNGALAAAAACYAAPFTIYRVDDRDLSDQDGEHREIRYYEPWPRKWRRTINLTPTTQDRIRELVKAGALIAAEIDRIQASL